MRSSKRMSTRTYDSSFVESCMADRARLVFVVGILIVLACLVCILSFFRFHLANNGVPGGSVLVALVVPCGILVGVPSFWLCIPSVTFTRVVPDHLMRVHVPTINEACRRNGSIAQHCTCGCLPKFQTNAVCMISVDAEDSVCPRLAVDDGEVLLQLLIRLQAVWVRRIQSAEVDVEVSAISLDSSWDDPVPRD